MESSEANLEPILEASELAQICADASNRIPALRQHWQAVQLNLDKAFNASKPVAPIIYERSNRLDELLAAIWNSFEWHDQEIALIAVGGYGRGELHPHSDVDLLILMGDECKGCERSIEELLTLLWDLKLTIGHSVRTVAECADKAREDITIATTLMESRLLAGHEDLLHEMHTATEPDKLWPSNDFFRAKWDEQKSRHAKYADTEYNLEPNVKASPGGLRDIQMIGWIAARHYGVRDPKMLAELGFLTEDELNILLNGRDNLWRVRYALHMITGREEDRLLFDNQRELARLFGYEDSDQRLAIEQFMQWYFRNAIALGQLNEVLMQHFDQVILRADTAEAVSIINERFRVRNGYIEASNDSVFTNTPSALLEIFVLCANRPDIEGIHVSTIRLIRDHRELIDDKFRADPRNRELFMELLRSPHKLARQLRRMNRYGVLGHYLPEWGNIVGQMQHDLFHIYTVDAHTLEVVKNMRRFLYPEFKERFPVTSRVASRLPKLELLYIAGLYHDIGKGRGGDHSELGAVDAEVFCRNHGVNETDTALICWLIQHHLYMSGVAQRKDISDPEVVQEFAETVGNQLRLDYLFALTVADITATNPTLWNAWRGSLLRQLYTETKRALSRGLETRVDKQDLIEETQASALAQLEDRGFIREEVMDLWCESGDEYFLREKPDDVVWHTQAIANHYDKESPLVLLKQSTTDNNIELATQIFIHVRAQDYLFAVIAAALEQLDLSVQDARVYNSIDGMAMDTFYVLDANGQSIAQDPGRIEHISEYLSELLSDQDRYPEIVRRRTPRQIKFFSVPTETNMTVDGERDLSVLEVNTPDRPGLLARVGRIFFEFNVELQAAKIATLGERVEDVFFITDQNGHAIRDPETISAIQKAICKELDEQAAA